MAFYSHAPYDYKPVPTFRTEVEKLRYWEQERKYWIEGYNGLTGPHYFYLSQICIKSGDGKTIHPRFRDVDAWIFEQYRDTVSKKRNLGVIKYRGFGLTSIFAGAMPMWYQKILPGSGIVMTSCDKTRIFKMFTDKIMVAYNNMHPHIRPLIHRKNETKNQGVYLALRQELINEYGESIFTDGDLLCQETMKNPSALSGTRAVYGWYDEWPLHKKREQLMASSDPCYSWDGQKQGSYVWGGTVEAEVDADGLEAIKRILQEKSMQATTDILFIEGWMGLIMDENGNSDKKAGIKKIEAELRALEGNTIAYNAHKKNYPLSISDVLELTADSLITPDVMAPLLERKRKIKSTDILRYDLIEDKTGNIISKLNRTGGSYFISQLPIHGHEYIAGCDPIPIDREGKVLEEHRRSKVGMWIKNLTTGSTDRSGSFPCRI